MSRQTVTTNQIINSDTTQRKEDMHLWHTNNKKRISSGWDSNVNLKANIKLYTYGNVSRHDHVNTEEVTKLTGSGIIEKSNEVYLDHVIYWRDCLSNQVDAKRYSESIRRVCDSQTNEMHHTVRPLSVPNVMSEISGRDDKLDLLQRHKDLRKSETIVTDEGAYLQRIVDSRNSQTVDRDEKLWVQYIINERNGDTIDRDGESTSQKLNKINSCETAEINSSADLQCVPDFRKCEIMDRNNYIFSQCITGFQEGTVKENEGIYSQSITGIRIGNTIKSDDDSCMQSMACFRNHDTFEKHDYKSWSESIPELRKNATFDRYTAAGRYQDVNWVFTGSNSFEKVDDACLQSAADYINDKTIERCAGLSLKSITELRNDKTIDRDDKTLLEKLANIRNSDTIGGDIDGYSFRTADFRNSETIERNDTNVRSQGITGPINGTFYDGDSKVHTAGIRDCKDSEKSNTAERENGVHLQNTSNLKSNANIETDNVTRLQCIEVQRNEATVNRDGKVHAEINNIKNIENIRRHDCLDLQSIADIRNNNLANVERDRKVHSKEGSKTRSVSKFGWIVDDDTETNHELKNTDFPRKEEHAFSQGIKYIGNSEIIQWKNEVYTQNITHLTVHIHLHNKTRFSDLVQTIQEGLKSKKQRFSKLFRN